MTADRDVALKQKVLDGTFFLQACGACQTRFQLTHSLLYHDCDTKVAIWLCEGGVSADLEDAMDSFGMVVSKDYRLRVVYDLPEMIEKIKIFESGLNDWYIQTLKMAVAGRAKTSADNVCLRKIDAVHGADIAFTFDIAGSDQAITLSRLENPRKASSRWDALETKFDWTYVNEANFYKVFAEFKDHLTE